MLVGFQFEEPPRPEFWRRMPLGAQHIEALGACMSSFLSCTQYRIGVDELMEEQDRSE